MHQHDLAEIARIDPRPDIRLIAADLDGTPVDDEKRIHDEFWPLVDELHARGITLSRTPVAPRAAAHWGDVCHRAARMR